MVLALEERRRQLLKRCGGGGKLAGARAGCETRVSFGSWRLRCGACFCSSCRPSTASLKLLAFSSGMITHEQYSQIKSETGMKGVTSIRDCREPGCCKLQLLYLLYTIVPEVQ